MQFVDEYSPIAEVSVISLKTFISVAKYTLCDVLSLCINSNYLNNKFYVAIHNFLFLFF